jgi:phospholipid/cholesterol/gamma-HCH transport system ATP-binding protein
VTNPLPDGAESGTFWVIATRCMVPTSAAATEPPFIEVRELRKSFGRQEVLRGLSLEIGRAETWVLLGGSGAGKSVLLKHLLGLLTPDSGQVIIEGEDLTGLNERQLGRVRRRIGMLFQGGALFDSLSVAENVAFPLRERGQLGNREIRARVAEVLEIVKLGDASEKMPADLSGGMRKRVAMARAVVERPAAVLFDEPHAGLDPVTADTIDHMIKDLQVDHGITNIVVTHEMRSVFRIADRVGFLKDGQLHWSGTLAEFAATTDPVLRAFIAGDSGGSWPGTVEL